MSFLFVHSLTEEKLFKALELGGFPLPSIAVIKPDTAFDSFGNITFIVKPDVLDPKDKKNLVYDRDIFSQRIPETEFDVDKKQLDKICNELYEKSKNFEKFYNFHDLDSFKRKPSYYIQERFESSLLLKKEFFDLHSENYSIPIKKSKLNSTLSESTIFVNYILHNEIILNNTFQEVLLKSLKEIEDKYTSLVGKEIADSIINDVTNSIFTIDNGSYIFKNNNQNMQHNQTIKNIFKDKEILLGNDLETDYIKYESDINDFIHKDLNSFKKHVNENYLNKVLYNPHFKNGNKKIEYSLQNIERIMLKQKTIGVEDASDTSVGKISSNFAKQFKSFDDINNSLSLLSNKEERFENKDSLHKQIFNLTEKIFPFYDGSRFIEAQESFSNSLKYGLNKNLFLNSLKSNGFDIDSLSDSFIDECYSVTNSLSVLENHYFEAKPQKTLYLKDFQAVLLPKNISNEIIDFLKDKVKIHFYDKNEPNSKYSILNQYKFIPEKIIEKKANKSLTKKQI
jgi:hypothetical protein